ncbi:MAG: glycoside hydrolase family 5 protein [Verrucomicrobiae bacterium]|nr:glycoside hydrolase family 5 protein [Verrucomicrobiae bacterium]
MRLRVRLAALACAACACFALVTATFARNLPWVGVSPDGRGFVLLPSHQPFVPWGFNYDRDDAGRLLEDYWERDWPRVASDFREMKALGANVVRVHLQFGRFMDSPSRPNRRALAQLSRLVRLAERTGLYLDVTGLGCYHKADVPGWYDALDEAGRWAAQAAFWRAVAERCRRSPAVFCYDLMNEPVVPGEERRAEWLGPALAGKHYVQFITRERRGRERTEIARAWVRHLVGAIRRVDARHLITVGLVDWSLERPGRLFSGFAPERIAPEVDFLSVHLYPESGALEASLETLRGFAVGRPVLVEETFPLRCSLEEHARFLEASRAVAAGWLQFYWGRTPEEYRSGRTFPDAIMAGALEAFRTNAPAFRKP